MNGVISDSEAVDCRPQAPSRPLAHVRMDLSSNNQRDEVADMCGDDRSAPQVRLVAHVCKQKDNNESQTTTNGSEGICSDAVET